MQRLWSWAWWIVLGLLVVVGSVAAGVAYMARPGPPAEANDPPPRELTASPAADRVEVVYPQQGGIERTSSQPGSVQAFESVDLYAGVSGYLKTQAVDIGDRVKRGQVLATVDVPDLEKQVERDAAALDQANARVRQTNARVSSARADLDAAKAAVTQAEATHKSKKAERRFREQQLRRMQDLFALKSIDERLVDEKTEQRDAAVEAENAAEAAIATARAQVAAATAKVEQADADVVEAQAEVKVAQADLDKARVLVKFATITAPFDGVITRRNFFPNDYVRAANEGAGHLPLLTVQRTDRFRVVVQIPDRDVPYTHPGDPATVEIDALGGKKFPGKVSRVSGSEDPDTRLMHVEVDLPNPTGEICNGMYGRALINLGRTKCLALPSSCLVGKARGGKGSVYVVRDGRAHLTAVQIGPDNGLQVAVLGGLSPEDRVIVNPGGGIDDGVPVEVEDAAATGR